MTLLTRAQAATSLGLMSMCLAAVGCPTCGATVLLALPAGAVGFMLARMTLADPRVAPDARAWAMFGLWSCGIGGGFSALAVATATLGGALWAAGIYGAASL